MLALCYTTGLAVMFNIGFGEMAIICIVLIVAVGPDRLPSMMKTLGKTIRTLRQASQDLRQQTGIDELLRGDFDITAPPRRPYTPPTPPTQASPAPISRTDEPVEPGEPGVSPAAPADAPVPPGSEAEPTAQNASLSGSVPETPEIPQTPSAGTPPVAGPAPLPAPDVISAPHEHDHEHPVDPSKPHGS